MARGGFRPGAGRKVKNPDMEPAPKRPVGRPKKAPVKKVADKVQAEEPVKKVELLDPPRMEGRVMPLDYMLQVMNDPEADKKRRDNMAMIAAPYCHKKADIKISKKEELESKIKNATSKFTACPAPKIVGRIGG